MAAERSQPSLPNPTLRASVSKQRKVRRTRSLLGPRLCYFVRKLMVLPRQAQNKQIYKTQKKGDPFSRSDPGNIPAAVVARLAPETRELIQHGKGYGHVKEITTQDEVTLSPWSAGEVTAYMVAPFLSLSLP